MASNVDAFIVVIGIGGANLRSPIGGRANGSPVLQREISFQTLSLGIRDDLTSEELRPANLQTCNESLSERNLRSRADAENVRKYCRRVSEEWGRDEHRT